MPRLSVSSAGEAGRHAHQTSGKSEDTDAHPAGHPRLVRRTRGRRALQAFAQDSYRVDRGRRSFVQAAREKRPHGERQSACSDRAYREVHEVALSESPMSEIETVGLGIWFDDLPV